MYACIKHIGKYENSYKSYEKLKNIYMKMNIKLLEIHMKRVYLTFFCESNEDNYMTEISIQVSR